MRDAIPTGQTLLKSFSKWSGMRDGADQRDAEKVLRRLCEERFGDEAT
jgi:hypothetical protein